MRPRWAMAAAVAVTATALAACSDNGPGSQAAENFDLDEIERLAQEEGQVVWYTGSLPDTIEVIQEAFEERYGIEVVVPQRFSSGDLAQRIQADVRNEGVVGADVVMTQDTALADYLYDEELARELSVDMFEGLSEEFMQGPGSVACVGVLPVIAYNTDVLGDFEPSSWEDLLDPRLDGQIMIADPRNSAAWAQMWSIILDALGDEYIEGLADLNYQPVASSLVGTEQLIAGQGGVLIAGIPALFEPAMADGLPIEYFLPADPAPVSFNSCTVSVGSQNPNAGMLFLHWLMSEEGQTLYADTELATSPLELPDAERALPLPDDYTEPPAPERVRGEIDHIVGLLGFT